MRYAGYTENHPFKDGDVVTIPKGVAIRTTHPTDKHKVAKVTRRIKVNHVLHGINDHDGQPKFNPTVVWAGTGGYWHEVDINDILEINGK